MSGAGFHDLKNCRCETCQTVRDRGVARAVERRIRKLELGVLAFCALLIGLAVLAASTLS